MKITKFAQSCILVETKGKRILVDPGNLQWEKSLLEKDWVNIDLILVTHKHGDHCHAESIKEIIHRDKAQLYTTQEVAVAYPELSPKIVKEGVVINFEDIKIEVVKAVHGYMPFLKGAGEVHKNVGYIIDNGKKKAYFTSDSISFKNDYKCNVIFVPVSNHGLVMGPFEAALFAKETGAELVIPIHYDNPKFPADLAKVEEEFNKQKLSYKILQIKEL